VFLARCLFLFCWILVHGLLVAQNADGTVTGTGLAGSATLGRDGRFQIESAAWQWSIPGRVGEKVQTMRVAAGSDSWGAYEDVRFLTEPSANSASWEGSIRLYKSNPAILFRYSVPDSRPNTIQFPQLNVPRQGVSQLTYTGIFAHPLWNQQEDDSPFLLFDTTGRSLMVSAAANFQNVQTRWENEFLTSRIADTNPTLPAGFRHRTLLVFGKQIPETMKVWGAALLAFGGKTPTTTNADITLSHFGYWTDAGAGYYYGYDPNLGYQGTLKAVQNELKRHGVTMGYLQLDSWWYPKGPREDWRDRSRGIQFFSADRQLFPDELRAFQQNLGVPLVVHARWIDHESPYRAVYESSGGVIVDETFWRDRADYLLRNGVAVFEQDWLGDAAQPEYNLEAPNKFMDWMARAMESSGLTMQYCMALPKHFLQGTRYQNLTTIRASMDRFARDKWDWFLYTSHLASSLGVLPWADVTYSTETENMAIMALSAGPVGIGDEIGKMNPENIRRTARADGLLVKPDAPLVPVAETYVADRSGKLESPMVAATYTEFDGQRYHYLYAYSRTADVAAVEIRPAEFKIQGDALLWDYFAGTARIIRLGESAKVLVGELGKMLLLSPVGPSGIAPLGDLGHFASFGKQRIPVLTDVGNLRFEMSFAPGESTREFSGWSAGEIAATQNGQPIPVVRDAATGVFRLSVSHPTPVQLQRR
jgi:hypothetical protein